MRKIVVTGASGVVGSALLELAGSYSDISVLALSRREKTGESPAGLYLDGYGFGGEADVCIDVVRDKSHMAYDAIIREIVLLALDRLPAFGHDTGLGEIVFLA